MDTKKDKRDFSIQAIISDMLHAPGFCFNREQFLRTEFKRFYSQEIIDKIIMSTPANIGVPPEVIEEIVKPLLKRDISGSRRFYFKSRFEDIYQTCYKGHNCILGFDPNVNIQPSFMMHSFLPRFFEDSMLRFCRELLCILQILFYIYGLQQININDKDTSCNSEILNFFIIAMGVVQGDAEARENFISIITLLRENNTSQQIIKEEMVEKIPHALPRMIAKRLEKILKEKFTSFIIPLNDSRIPCCKNISDCLKLELYYPQYIQTLRENRSLI